MKGDYIKIPTPQSETLEAILAHPETKFKWMAHHLYIANKNFPTMVAHFKPLEFEVDNGR